MAWIDLLLLANHESKDFFDHRGNVIQGEQGTVYRSILFLSERWGWSKNKVNHFLNQLVKMEMIKKKSTTQGTTLTIVNYDDYQKQGSTKGSTQGKPEGSPRETQGKPEDTYKKSKKSKNVEEENNLSPEERRERMIERQRREEAEEYERITGHPWKE